MSDLSARIIDVETKEAVRTIGRLRIVFATSPLMLGLILFVTAHGRPAECTPFGAFAPFGAILPVLGYLAIQVGTSPRVLSGRARRASSDDEFDARFPHLAGMPELSDEARGTASVLFYYKGLVVGALTIGEVGLLGAFLGAYLCSDPLKFLPSAIAAIGAAVLVPNAGAVLARAGLHTGEVGRFPSEE